MNTEKTIGPFWRRAAVRVLTLLAIGGASVLGMPQTASAAPVITPWPIGVDANRSHPPQFCGPGNDGETIVWDGWVWRCEVVIGAVPPWQWEPLRRL